MYKVSFDEEGNLLMGIMREPLDGGRFIWRAEANGCECSHVTNDKKLELEVRAFIKELDDIIIVGVELIDDAEKIHATAFKIG